MKATTSAWAHTAPGTKVTVLVDCKQIVLGQDEDGHYPGPWT